MNITYNTAEEHLKLPKYGRLVQKMIERATSIEDRQQRQAYAEKIISVMGALNPQMRNTPNYKQTLWNHLALMSDYRLDVEFPYPIEQNGERLHPHKLSYPNNKIRYRHYGLLLEKTIQKLENMPADAPGRDKLVSMTAARMKRNLTEWKGGNAENEKVSRDLSAYTHGIVEEETAMQILEKVSRQTPHFAGQVNRGFRRVRK